MATKPGSLFNAKGQFGAPTNGKANLFDSATTAAASQGENAAQVKPNPFAPSSAVVENKAEAKPNPFASASVFGNKTESPAPAKLNPFAGAFQPGNNASAPVASPFGASQPSFGQPPPSNASNGPASTGGAISNPLASTKPSPFAAASPTFGGSTAPGAARQTTSTSPALFAPSATTNKTPSPFTAPVATTSTLGGTTGKTPQGGAAASGSLFGPPPSSSPAPNATSTPVTLGIASSPSSSGLLDAGKPQLSGQTGTPTSLPPQISSSSKGSLLSAISQSTATSQDQPSSTSVLGMLGQPKQPVSTDTPSVGLPKSASTFTTIGQSPLPKPAAEEASTASPSLSTKAAEPPKEPPGPPRDLLGDFSNWFVNGDNGLLSDFLVESVRWITSEAFKQFTQESEERKRREEEERTNAEVERFRVYNLSLKFLYRWKRAAREKRLRALRRKARDEQRTFYAARQEAERKEREDSRRASERRDAEQEAAGHSKEFLSLMKSRRAAQRDATESLLASGILSGLGQERQMARAIVNDELRSSNGSQSSRRPSFSSSVGPSRKEGSKTQALRRKYFDQPDKFRRSLPSLSSEDRGSPGVTKRSSNASSRWRLKAMGIVPLDDGTAVPESLAREMAASGSLRYSRSVSPWRRRRLSATDAIQAEMQRLPPTSHGGDGSSPVNNLTLNSKRKRDDANTSELDLIDGSSNKRVMSDSDRPGLESAVETSPANKRKRAVDDDVHSPVADGGAQKRIISDAEMVTMELQALRAEMEEGTEWYKSQIERFRSESEAGGTSWFDESI